MYVLINTVHCSNVKTRINRYRIDRYRIWLTCCSTRFLIVRYCFKRESN